MSNGPTFKEFLTEWTGFKPIKVKKQKLNWKKNRYGSPISAPTISGSGGGVGGHMGGSGGPSGGPSVAGGGGH